MSKGYTLIEMLVVLAILAGMAALSLPSIDRLVKRIQDDNLVRIKIEHLRALRKLAIEEDGPLWIGDHWYGPFQCEHQVFIVAQKKIILGEFWEISIKAID